MKEHAGQARSACVCSRRRTRRRNSIREAVHKQLTSSRTLGETRERWNESQGVAADRRQPRQRAGRVSTAGHTPGCDASPSFAMQRSAEMLDEHECLERCGASSRVMHACDICSLASRARAFLCCRQLITDDASASAHDDENFSRYPRATRERPQPARTPHSPRPPQDRKSTRLNSSHSGESRMPSSA